MKSIEYIESLDQEALENIARSSSADVPADLKDRVDAAVIAAELQKGNRRPARAKALPYVFGAIAAAALAAVVFISVPSGPEDTFDDPYLAYAELERTLSLVSEKMGRGLELSAGAEPVIQRAVDVINNIND